MVCFLFLLRKLQAVHVQVGVAATTMLKAGRASESMLRVWNSHCPTMPLSATHACSDHWKRFCALTDDLPDVQIPKRHIVVHLLQSIPFLGNPHRYANWLDESLNKDLKRCCRTVSQATFETFLLLRMRIVLAASNSKRKAVV